MSCEKEVPSLEMVLVRCAEMPTARTSAMCFAVEGKAYVLGGRDSIGWRHNDLWQYDPACDRWAQLGATPLRKRVNGIACTVGERVYTGLGFDGVVLEDSSYLQDFWCYHPTDNSWERLADCPSKETVGAVCFSDGATIYVAYGNQRYFERNVWAYDIAENRWRQLRDETSRSSNNPPRVLSATGASCGGRHYLGTGYHKHSLDFWAEMLPGEEEVSWRMCKELPGKGRNSACCAGSEKYIYVAGGRYFGGSVTDGLLQDDILRYDPASDSWAQCCHMPTGAENMVAFRIGEAVYFGLGNDKDNNILRTLYKLVER